MVFFVVILDFLIELIFTYKINQLNKANHTIEGKSNIVLICRPSMTRNTIYFILAVVFYFQLMIPEYIKALYCSGTMKDTSNSFITYSLTRDILLVLGVSCLIREICR